MPEHPKKNGEHPLKDEPAETNNHDISPLAALGKARKNFLVFIFAVATFVDVCNVSGISIAVADIGQDTGLGVSQLVWVSHPCAGLTIPLIRQIITSYSLCFAAFLLFAGRLSDLFPAQIIFIAGFAGLGIFSLVVSFVTHSKFAFLIIRGLGGICGAMTIPSS